MKSRTTNIKLTFPNITKCSLCGGQVLTDKANFALDATSKQTLKTNNSNGETVYINNILIWHQNIKECVEND